jgi:hypothetical protein
MRTILKVQAALSYLNFLMSIFETWSLTLREEHRLRVFKNKVLSRIFGPKRDEGGENCIMRSFVIRTLVVIKSRRMRWEGHVARGK